MQPGRARRRRRATAPPATPASARCRTDDSTPRYRDSPLRARRRSRGRPRAEPTHLEALPWRWRRWQHDPARSPAGDLLRSAPPTDSAGVASRPARKYPARNPPPPRRERTSAPRGEPARSRQHRNRGDRSRLESRHRLPPSDPLQTEPEAPAAYATGPRSTRRKGMIVRADPYEGPIVLPDDPSFVAEVQIDYPGYRSTQWRAPARPLGTLPEELDRLDGPVFGEDTLGPSDSDLTRQHEGEPLGERIINHRRVLDSDGRPLRAARRRPGRDHARTAARDRRDRHNHPRGEK